MLWGMGGSHLYREDGPIFVQGRNFFAEKFLPHTSLPEDLSTP